MDGRFPQPNTGVPEVPNSDFVGVINNSLMSLPVEQRENIIKCVQRWRKLNWTNRAIADELDLRFHIKIGGIKKPTTKPH